MDCCVLAGGRSNPGEDFLPDGDLTRLERWYRRYAAVFETVKLVLKESQATEHYLNYPYIVDDEPEQSMVVGIRAALKNADSDAVFIGSSDITDFPLELIVNLVKQYKGELFLGYTGGPEEPSTGQPLFGIYHKRLVEQLDDSGSDTDRLFRLLEEEGRLLRLPSDDIARKVGLDRTVS